MTQARLSRGSGVGIRPAVCGDPPLPDCYPLRDYLTELPNNGTLDASGRSHTLGMTTPGPQVGKHARDNGVSRDVYHGEWVEKHREGPPQGWASLILAQEKRKRYVL